MDPLVLVLRVVNWLPQPQVTCVSTYAGWMPSRTGIPLDVAPGPLRGGVNRRRSVTVYSTIPQGLLFPAGGRAAVDPRGAVRADEAPVVPVGSQGHREHADRLVPADLAARLRAGEAAQAVPAGADDELHRPLADLTLGRARGEAFVVVVVPVEDHVDASVGELRPQRLERRVAAVLEPGGEPRPVEGRHRALR